MDGARVGGSVKGGRKKERGSWGGRSLIGEQKAQVSSLVFG